MSLSCSLGSEEEDAPQFIMDYSMNKIAKYFRLLGYDTLCSRHLPQRELIFHAANEGRCLVTASRRLYELADRHNQAVAKQQQAATSKPHTVVAYDSDGESIYSDSSELLEQEVPTLFVTQWCNHDFHAVLIDLIQRARLSYRPRFVFSRCVTCNVVLEYVEKTAVRDRVEPKIYAMYDEFTHCPVCAKVFWGFDGSQVINYKSFRTLELLRGLCLAAGAPVAVEQTCLATLRSFRSFPRNVKVCIFSYLTSRDLGQMSLVFPTLRDLALEVEDCRRRGCEVKPFREIKNCK